MKTEMGRFFRKIDDVLIAFNQIITYVLISRIVRYYFRANRKKTASIKDLRRGSLIVANHQSVLDPFIILSHLPIRSFLNVIPVRFPTTHKYYKNLRFLACVGAYDIGSGSKEKMIGLFKTRQYLIDGRSIMLFPEGKICSNSLGNMSEFQEGITFMTDVARSSIFVRMEGFHRSDWLKVWQKNRIMAFSDIYDFKGERKNIKILRDCMESLSS